MAARKVDWKSIKLEYCERGLSIREIARQFGVTDTAIRKRAKSDGWVRREVRPDGAQTDPAQLGRPARYDEAFDEQAKKLCRLGATDLEIADFFSIDRATFYRWKLSHLSFCEAVQLGKAACDDRVERSLYERAVGYTFDSVKVFMPAGAKEPVYAPVKEHVPPDVGAAFNWLKNRRPGVWRDRHEHEIGRPGDFDRLSDAELRASIAREVALALPGPVIEAEAEPDDGTRH